MVKLEDFTVGEIRKIVSKYNKTLKISGYARLKKPDLIDKLRNHKSIILSETEKGLKITVTKQEIETDKKEKKPKKTKQSKPEPKPKPKPKPKKPEPKPEPKKKFNKDFDFKDDTEKTSDISKFTDINLSPIENITEEEAKKLPLKEFRKMLKNVRDYYLIIDENISKIKFDTLNKLVVDFYNLVKRTENENGKLFEIRRLMYIHGIITDEEYDKLKDILFKLIDQYDKFYKNYEIFFNLDKRQKEQLQKEIDEEVKSKPEFVDTEKVLGYKLEEPMRYFIQMKKSFLKNSGVIFPAFSCASFVSDYIYLKILKDNNSDCFYYNPDGDMYSGKNKLMIGVTYGAWYHTKPLRKEFPLIADEVDKKRKELGLDNKKYDLYEGGYNSDFLRNDGIEKMYEVYKECEKKKLLLCIPMTIGNRGGHRNMLIINPYTHTIERYEPHGGRTGGIEINMKDYNADIYNPIIEDGIVRYFNKKQKELGEKEFKFLDTGKTCPRIPNKIKKSVRKLSEKKLEQLKEMIKEKGYGIEEEKKKQSNGRQIIHIYLNNYDKNNPKRRHNFAYKGKALTGNSVVVFDSEVDFLKEKLGFELDKEEDDEGFQSIQGDEIKEESLSMYNSILYKEVGGYCCMWSFFYMDLRLKNPKDNPQDVLGIALNELKQDPQDLTNFIRAYTERFMRDMNKTFGGKFYEDFTKTLESEGVKGGRASKKKTQLERELRKKVSEFLDLTKGTLEIPKYTKL